MCGSVLDPLEIELNTGFITLCQYKGEVRAIKTSLPFNLTLVRPKITHRSSQTEPNDQWIVTESVIYIQT